MEQADPRELARVLDHSVRRVHVELDDLLQLPRKDAVQLADISDRLVPGTRVDAHRASPSSNQIETKLIRMTLASLT
jgi:hypothetical protein